MAKTIAELHHQRVCRNANGDRAPCAGDPCRCCRSGRYNPACRYWLGDDGRAFITAADIDQRVQLIEARGKQYQALACIPALEVVDAIDRAGAK